MNCIKCGNEINEETKFCTNCGVHQDAISCQFCEGWINPDQPYCPTCGGMARKDSLEKILNITITDEDIADYCFKGYIEKTLDIGKISITIKTLTQDELIEAQVEADKRIQGENIMNDTYTNVKALEEVKRSLVGINGKKPSVIGAELTRIVSHKLGLLQNVILEAIQRGQLSDF